MNQLVLILGLLLFVGVHSTRVLADGWRTRTIRRVGEAPWKGVYSLVSLAGIALIVWGYGMARQDPVLLWPAPGAWTRHLAALLTVPAFVLLVASQVPGNHIKARLRHPMVLGVKLWAAAHLLANNTLADVLLFGSLLLWAVLSFRAARQRDRASAAAGQVGAPLPANAGLRTGLVLVVGLTAWAGFAFWAHAAWIGVRPFG